jgi:hypothetical protein
MNDNIAPKALLTPTRDYFTFAHIASVVAIFIACVAIFSITGDSDLFGVLGSGIGVWLVAGLFATMHRRKKQF